MEKREPQNFPNSEKSPEQTQADLRLPPEIEEVVMKKVSDINQKGTAFTSIRGLKIDQPGKRVRLKDIFEMGLLGGETGNFAVFDKKQKISSWRDASRQGKSQVWVNIVGRDISSVSDAYWLRIDETDLGIIIDLDKFKEKIPETFDRSKGSSKTFRASRGNFVGDTVNRAIDAGFDPNGTMDELRKFLIENRDKLGITDETMKYFNSQYYLTNPDTGFVVSHRVAPRDLKGIVFRPVRKVTVRGMDEFAHGEIEYDDPDTVKKKFNALVNQMKESYVNKPELLMPIYDERGNLLWPKEISYMDVKKLTENN